MPIRRVTALSPGGLKSAAPQFLHTKRSVKAMAAGDRRANMRHVVENEFPTKVWRMNPN